MKKLLVLSVALVSITSLYYCQNKKKQIIQKAQNIQEDDSARLSNDWQKDALRGKVRACVESEFVAKDSFGEIKKTLQSRKSYWKYDYRGNMIESIAYNSDGSVRYKYNYYYDDKGNNFEIICYSSNGSIIEKSTYKYDDIGNPIEQNDYAADGSLQTKYLYKCDYRGNKNEIITYNSDGSLRYKSIYKYDGEGNKISYKRFKANGILDESSKYSYYDNLKHITEETRNATYGSYTKYSWYHEFISGLLIQEVTYGKKSVWDTLNKYVVDDYQNWIKKVVYVNDSPKYIVERKYYYYE